MATLGKFRHLSQCATEAGHFVILAIDHRGNLLNDLNRHAGRRLTDDEFAAFKQEVIGGLVAEASGVLTDPAYGLGKGIADRTIPGRVGLLAPLEVTDYSLRADQRRVHFIPDWSVEKIKRIGGSGVKLLLFFHPDAADSLEKQAIVEQIVNECQAYDIPFFLEPITYSLAPDQPLSNTELEQVTVHMARRFSALGVDVLKLQFPLDVRQTADESVWRAACEAVNRACTVPWALLSGGVDYSTFVKQARIACESGASGVIVGRAVWGEAVALQGAACRQFIHDTAIQRMRELANQCFNAAQPWYGRVSKPNDAYL
jgi:tagatose 1,6-diphosphate aldolase